MGPAPARRERARFATPSLTRSRRETLYPRGPIVSRRTMNWRFVGGTLLIVHGLAPPDANEWREFIIEAMGAGPEMRQVLVFADVALSPLQ